MEEMVIGTSENKFTVVPVFIGLLALLLAHPSRAATESSKSKTTKSSRASGKLGWHTIGRRLVFDPNGDYYNVVESLNKIWASSTYSTNIKKEIAKSLSLSPHGVEKALRELSFHLGSGMRPDALVNPETHRKEFLVASGLMSADESYFFGHINRSAYLSLLNSISSMVYGFRYKEAVHERMIDILVDDMNAALGNQRDRNVATHDLMDVSVQALRDSAPERIVALDRQRLYRDFSSTGQYTLGLNFVLKAGDEGLLTAIFRKAPDFGIGVEEVERMLRREDL